MTNNMKTKYCLLYMLGLLAFTSCVDDEGNNNMSDVNEAKIEGIEDSYYKVADVENLEIPVKVTGTLSGDDQNSFDYMWYLCAKDIGGTQHSHTVISNEKDLSYPLTNIRPGTYSIYFRATDKATKLIYEKNCQLNVISPYVRGFYLYGDKEDGTVGIDFVSMLEERDTTVIADMFENTRGIKHAKNLFFTGCTLRGAEKANLEYLYAVTDDNSYPLTHSSSESKIGFADVNFNDMSWPTISTIQKPLKVLDIWPHAYGSSNIMRSSTSRYVLTDQAMFFGSLYLGESYGNPANCYVQGDDKLVDIAPYGFYPNNLNRTSTVYLFDRTNHKFVKLANTYSANTNLASITDTKEGAFWLDQTEYTPVRDLVYGENGKGNNGASYALMNDADGKYYVYIFVAGAYQFKKMTSKNIDLSVATDFTNASHYAFYSNQYVILYSVGHDLWAYNYNSNKAQKLKTFDGEITYMAFDVHSDDNPDDIIVATWSDAEKGIVYKYEMEDSPNELKINEKEYATKNYPWKTNLKVVKVEYRNCSD